MLLLQANMEKNLLNNSVACKLQIEKSSLALSLEKEMGIEWALHQDTPFDSYFDLRACLVNELTIEPGECAPIPTGIYPQLGSPNFILEVSSNHDLIYQQGLSVFDSPMLFSFTFRNEIWVLIKNNFKTAQTVQPSKKIAILSIRQLPQVQLEYVTQIEETPWNFITSKRFIKEIKKNFYPEIYNLPKQKLAEFYSREDIKNFIRKHDGS